MSMCLSICTLGDANIARVLADPPLVWKVISPDNPELYETARSEGGGFFSRLFGGQARDRGADAAEFELSTDEDDTLGYCVEYFATLQAFVAKAASREVGLVIYLA
jgi:hypothetical protein